MPIGNSTKKKNHSHNFISKFDQMFVGAIKLDGEVKYGRSSYVL